MLLCCCLGDVTDVKSSIKPYIVIYFTNLGILPELASDLVLESAEDQAAVV